MNARKRTLSKISSRSENNEATSPDGLTTCTEAEVQKRIIEAANQRHDMRLFRNQVGCYKVGNRMIRTGLCPGSADLIGWRQVTITPDMVGTTIAQFLSVEVKSPKGRVALDQQRWADAVARDGGCAILARRVEDLP